jgi:hypothetical protein
VLVFDEPTSALDDATEKGPHGHTRCANMNRSRTLACGSVRANPRQTKVGLPGRGGAHGF